MSTTSRIRNAIYSAVMAYALSLTLGITLGIGNPHPPTAQILSHPTTRPVVLQAP